MPQFLSPLGRTVLTLFVICSSLSLHAQDQSRLNGKNYEERCQQLVAYFAAAKPRNA
ncbi:MAG: hypothetical protein RL117_713, partial [Verrucomicrobiota bacterium]